MKKYMPPRAGRAFLLSRPGTAVSASLQQALDATARAFPMPAQHKKDLPPAIRDLSRMLTEERGDLHKPYWAAPRYLAAYLYYFLPWNIYRLAWLLPNLDMPLRPGARVLDLGSGPLTMPIALWCARPDLRNVPLEFVCTDVAAKPMELGRDTLAALAGAGSPWRIQLVRAPLEKFLHTREQSLYDCVLAGNVINELTEERRNRRSVPLSERLDAFVDGIRAKLNANGRCLLVEPGTRLGGKLITLCRQSALGRGLSPLAPCTHAAACPMVCGSMAGDAPEPRDKESFATRFSGWCHFTMPAAHAPAPLRALSAQARMDKDQLALSCLLLQAATTDNNTQAARQSGPVRPNKLDKLDELDELEALYLEIMQDDSGKGAGDAAMRSGTAPGQSHGHSRTNQTSGPEAASLPLRVISAPIALPGQTEPARYACCQEGLALLLEAADCPSGTRVEAELPRHRQRDAKSGALVARRPDKKTSERREDAATGNKAAQGGRQASLTGKGQAPREKVRDRKTRTGPANAPDARRSKQSGRRKPLPTKE